MNKKNKSIEKFPNSKGNVPNIRFSEFSEEWEVDNFKSLTKINQGLQISIDKRFTKKVRDSYFYITNEFLKENSNKEYYILNPSKSVLCSKEDVLMTRTGNTGQVVTNVEGAFHNNFFKIKYDKNKLNKDFLVYFLRLYKTQILILRLAGTSTIPDLNHSDFYRFKISYPNLLEQNKIADFLTKLDERISAQRELIKELEKQIKGYQQKLFSQEIRFKNDNGKEFPKWEEKKLGEIGFFQTSSIDKLSKSNEKSVYLVNYMDVYKHKTINNDTIKDFQKVTARDNQIKSCNLMKGDILFTPSSETPTDIGHSVVIYEDINQAVYSYHLVRFRPNIKINILYSHYFCNISNVLNQLAKFATGSTRFTISVHNFSKVKIELPCLEEQTKIANFLFALDNKLKAEKDLLKEYESQKKYFLQNMFV